MIYKYSKNTQSQTYKYIKNTSKVETLDSEYVANSRLNTDLIENIKNQLETPDPDQDLPEDDWSLPDDPD